MPSLTRDWSEPRVAADWVEAPRSTRRRDAPANEGAMPNGWLRRLRVDARGGWAEERV